MSSEVFLKFAVFIGPFCVIYPAPISKKSLFGVVNLKAIMWYGATFWSLSIKFETLELWLYVQEFRNDDM